MAAASLVLALDASDGGRPQRHFLGHTAHVCALALSADGALLASAQEGRTAVVRLWDWASGACLAVLCGEWRRCGAAMGGAWMHSSRA